MVGRRGLSPERPGHDFPEEPKAVRRADGGGEPAVGRSLRVVTRPTGSSAAQASFWPAVGPQMFNPEASVAHQFVSPFFQDGRQKLLRDRHFDALAQALKDVFLEGE